MNDLLIQQPAHAAADAQLLLMFHGVGATPDGLVPLGQQLASAIPKAWIVSVRSPHPSDFGRGWQWFSAQGLTEQSRSGRIAAAMQLFKEAIVAWQRRSGVPPERTTLLGFSQGSNMALASTQEDEMLAGRVVSLDVFPGLAHAIDERVVDKVRHYLASP